MLTAIVVVRIILDIYGMGCLEPEEGVRISNGALSKNSKKSLKISLKNTYVWQDHQKCFLKPT
jgi:hypothetical protein